MDYEVGNSPFVERKEAIIRWRSIASEFVREESPEILELAEELKSSGIKTYDALHIACAKSAGCSYFITAERKLLRVRFDDMRVVNPIQFIYEVEESE